MKKIIFILLSTISVVFYAHAHYTAPEHTKDFVRDTINENIGIYKSLITQTSDSKAVEASMIERIAAYDVGSTGVKYMVVDVNLDTNKIEDVIFQDQIDHEKDINESNYRDRLALFMGVKSTIDKLFPAPLCKRIHHIAVATAGFRQSPVFGERLSIYIEGILDLEFDIISQDEEAILAFDGVQATHAGFNASKDIVWDVGGGSMQIVYKDPRSGQFMVLGNKVGTRNARNAIIEKVKEQDLNFFKTSNPLSVSQLSDSFKLIDSFLVETPNVDNHYSSLTASEVRKVKEKMSSGATVYAIGALHNRQILYLVNAVHGTNNAYYTKQDVLDVINDLVDQSDEQINDRFNAGNPREITFVGEYIPSLIVIYKTMQLLGLDRVEVIDINNTTGLIHQYMETLKVKTGPEYEYFNSKFKSLIF